MYFLYLNDLDENQAILNLTELLDQDEFRNIYERKVVLPSSGSQILYTLHRGRKKPVICRTRGERAVRRTEEKLSICVHGE